MLINQSSCCRSGVVARQARTSVPTTVLAADAISSAAADRPRTYGDHSGAVHGSRVPATVSSRPPGPVATASTARPIPSSERRTCQAQYRDGGRPSGRGPAGRASAAAARASRTTTRSTQRQPPGQRPVGIGQGSRRVRVRGDVGDLEQPGDQEDPADRVARTEVDQHPSGQHEAVTMTAIQASGPLASTPVGT